MNTGNYHKYIITTCTINVHNNYWLLAFQTAVESFLLYRRTGWVDFQNLNGSMASQLALLCIRIALLTENFYVRAYAHVHAHVYIASYHCLHGCNWTQNSVADLI